MKRVLLFGGTGESHELVRFLCENGCRVTLSVAGDYAAGLMERYDSLSIIAGRLTAKQMEAVMADGGFDCVIDATHPYAKEATANIRAAAEKAGIACLRFLRGESDMVGFDSCADIAEAAGRLSGTEGPILVATGSKELEKYTVIPDFAERCFVRVLPAVEALERCAELGFKRERVIAMQGPFSRELNAALFKQLGIKHLVTKDGGAAGGFPEKAEAARECGVAVTVVRRPEETGLSMDGIKAELEKLLAL